MFRFSILYTLLVSIILVIQVYGVCKLQTASWSPIPCQADKNEKELTGADVKHCGKAEHPKTDHCCGGYTCDQYKNDDVVWNQARTVWETNIQCVPGGNCGGLTISFDQTDCGNINGCLNGGICCSKQISDPPHKHD